ncbi:MAG: hypothetical protein ACYCU7_19050 [Acidimicrobiales bacterium]
MRRSGQTQPSYLLLKKDVALKPYFQPGFLGEATTSADTAFLLGQSAYHEMGGWLLGTAISAPPTFKLNAILFPEIPGTPGKQKDVTLACTTLAVSKHANMPLVQAFFEWFTRPEIAAKYVGIIADWSPYSLGRYAPAFPAVARAPYKQITKYLDSAGKGGAVLYNDEAINASIYPKYIWEGSVGLMSGALTPAGLAHQLEAATVAAQKIDNKH